MNIPYKIITAFFAVLSVTIQAEPVNLDVVVRNVMVLETGASRSSVYVGAGKDANGEWKMLTDASHPTCPNLKSIGFNAPYENDGLTEYEKNLKLSLIMKKMDMAIEGTKNNRTIYVSGDCIQDSPNSSVIIDPVLFTLIR